MNKANEFSVLNYFCVLLGHIDRINITIFDISDTLESLKCFCHTTKHACTTSARWILIGSEDHGGVWYKNMWLHIIHQDPKHKEVSLDRTWGTQHLKYTLPQSIPQSYRKGKIFFLWTKTYLSKQTVNHVGLDYPNISPWLSLTNSKADLCTFVDNFAWTMEILKCHNGEEQEKRFKLYASTCLCVCVVLFGIELHVFMWGCPPGLYVLWVCVMGWDLISMPMGMNSGWRKASLCSPCLSAPVHTKCDQPFILNSP